MLPDLNKNFFVTVENEYITDISQSRPDGIFDREIECRGNLLTSGMYNSHCHAAMTLFRGYGEDLPLDRWLNERIFPAEDKLTDESVLLGSMIAIAEMIKNGIVSFTDMYFFCNATADAVLGTGIKANIARSIVSFDPDADPASDSRIIEAQELFRNYHNAANGRIRIDMALHAEYTNTQKHAAYVSELAAVNDTALQIHLSETKKEHDECIARHGMTPTEFFLKAGAFNVPVSAAHCVYLTDSDMDILAVHGATAVHNPISNLKLGSGVMPLKKMLEKGVNVALGTDGAASNNQLDLFSELRFASILHKGVSCDPCATTANKMWDIATVNGARSQCRPDCGKAEVGYRADLILVDLDALNNQPIYDLYNTLAYSANSSNVLMTMVDGKILYENGEFKTIDIEGLKAEFARVCEHYFD
jgi:5-methylthioadenosine/S-adenosylhomocysteine deaminase